MLNLKKNKNKNFYLKKKFQHTCGLFDANNVYIPVSFSRTSFIVNVTRLLGKS
jgi:hypothetical protein